MKSTVCLTMMVKNEERIIERCLNSCVGVIDTALIVDTGSTDSTREKIAEYLHQARIPFEIKIEPWVNFGHNRTRTMQLAAGRADYLLLMDACYVLEVIEERPPTLNQACYDLVLHSGNLAWAVPKLVASGIDWKFIGVTHEYLAPVVPPAEFPYWRIIKHNDGARRPVKFEDDRVLLEADLNEKSRTIFYLAQTYRDTGRYAAAALLYELRSTLYGWEEEGWYALWQHGEMLLKMGRRKEAIATLCDAYRRRPTRVEPLRTLIAIGCTEWLARANSIPLPSEDRLFVQTEMYHS